MTCKSSPRKTTIGSTGLTAAEVRELIATNVDGTVDQDQVLRHGTVVYADRMMAVVEGFQVNTPHRCHFPRCCDCLDSVFVVAGHVVSRIGWFREDSGEFETTTEMFVRFAAERLAEDESDAEMAHAAE